MNQQVRVLIADDQRAARQGLHALLAQYPQIDVVGEAANGRETVQATAQFKPDVVIMDMKMPVMDGMEATRRIKSQWPHIRVVALTLYNGYRTKALQAGVDTFLLKGCTADCLLDAILNQVPSNEEVR